MSGCENVHNVCLVSLVRNGSDGTTVVNIYFKLNVELECQILEEKIMWVAML